MFGPSISRDRRIIRRNLGKHFRRFSCFGFQGKWPQKISRKFLHASGPRIPQGLNQNSFTALLWELGGGGPKIDDAGKTFYPKYLFSNYACGEILHHGMSKLHSWEAWGEKRPPKNILGINLPAGQFQKLPHKITLELSG